MFNAVTAVTAGVIVALLGGLFLVGQFGDRADDQPIQGAVSPSPSASAESIPPPTAQATDSPSQESLTASFADMDLRTRNITDQVVRVLGDQHGHSLVDARQFDVWMGPTGKVWVHGVERPGEGVQPFVLGEPGVLESPPMDFDPNRPGPVAHAVDSDGRIFHASSYYNGLQIFEGTSWTNIPGGRDVFVGADGAAWLRIESHGDAGLEEVEIARYLDGELTTWGHEDGIAFLGEGRSNCPITECRYPDLITVASDGRAWVAGEGKVESHPSCGPGQPRTSFISGGLAYFDGEAWHDVNPLGPGRRFAVRGMAVASDGTLWAIVLSGPRDAVLASFDGERWRTWRDGKDRFFAANGDDPLSYAMAVGLDGQVWFEAPTNVSRACTGLMVEATALVSFDGDRFRHRLGRVPRPVEGGKWRFVHGSEHPGGSRRHHLDPRRQRRRGSLCDAGLICPRRLPFVEGSGLPRRSSLS